MKKLLGVRQVMVAVKAMYQKQLEKDCLDENVMNDIDEDHNKILQVVAIKYLIQNIRLLLLVSILTAMLGMITFYVY